MLAIRQNHFRVDLISSMDLTIVVMGNMKTYYKIF